MRMITGWGISLATMLIGGCSPQVLEIYPIFHPENVAPAALEGADFVDVSMADGGFGLVRTTNGDLAKTDDDGLSWRVIEGPGEDVTALAVVADQTAVVIAKGIYQTTDAGETWTQSMGSSSGGLTHIDALPTGTIAYVTESRNIYVSKDSGVSFQQSPARARDTTTALQLLDDTRIVLASDESNFDDALTGYDIDTGASFTIHLRANLISGDIPQGLALRPDETGVVVTRSGQVLHRGNPDIGFYKKHFQSNALNDVAILGSTQVAVGNQTLVSLVDLGYGPEWYGFLGPEERSPQHVLRSVSFSSEDAMMVAGEDTLWRIDVDW